MKDLAKTNFIHRQKTERKAPYPDDFFDKHDIHVHVRRVPHQRMVQALVLA